MRKAHLSKSLIVQLIWSLLKPRFTDEETDTKKGRCPAGKGWEMGTRGLRVAACWVTRVLAAPLLQNTERKQ